MSDRARLTSSAARAERLATRNRAQAAMLKRAARGMGDRATAFVDQQTTAKDSDDAAIATAMRGRYLARTLAEDPA